MNEIGRLQRALDFLIEQNTRLHHRLVLAENGNFEEACQAAMVAALLAFATAEGTSVDELPNERFDKILKQIEGKFK